MGKLIINGGKPLYGKVPISGARNSALALIPAALLGETPSVIENVPQIKDVETYIDLLSHCGVNGSFSKNECRIDPSSLQSKPIKAPHFSKLRASMYLMGVMLSKFKEVQISPSLGALGWEPLDQHFKGFQSLGVTIDQQADSIHLYAKKLMGTRIYLDVVSVGATINLMLAAVHADGKTIIENAAKEPEVIDVATLLSSMGANIKGAGTDVIRIQGVRKLLGCRHSVIPDRIEAGTWMIAGAATRGTVTIEQIIPKHLEAVSAKLREMGAKVVETDETITVYGNDQYEAVDIKTYPYPGFPTDLQQSFTSLLTQADGTSLVTENVYSSRLTYVHELVKMGALIRAEGRTAIITGVTPLHGTNIQATEIRAGASLVIAGLVANHVTTISGIDFLCRGYENLEMKLSLLGAEIHREW
ncbi:UDP-N-acetylglucosamine 1-carboxyvinyltransferase [Hazenella coriacea]|uniref:UDP-N-acetylglucosamine 1-carboxyvinyltransferase n=1 Tax=Hazenella coriacea TaxID=1179467 RepID=UPI00104C0221|nr:UDP-N-acetylglucosamine 1-carboxyvinyltransferase [Hazenella coriacea]